MFSNFAWSEMLVIACVAIIVVGPKDLPGMLRSLGKTIGSMKRMAGDFQRQFNDALKEAEVDDLKDLTSAKGFGPLDDAKKSMEDLTRSINETVTDDTDALSETAADTLVEEAKANDTAKAKPAPAKKTPAKKAPAKRKTAAAASKAATASKSTSTRKTAAKSSPAKVKSAS